jgi:hypothetical protein
MKLLTSRARQRRIAVSFRAGVLSLASLRFSVLATHALDMNTTLSKAVFGLSCVALAVTTLFTLLWFSIVIDHDGRGAVATRSVVGPVLGGALLALAVVPSGVLFVRWRQRRDKWSFVISGISLLGILGEIGVLYCVRLHGPW